MVLDLLRRRRSITELDTHFIYYLECNNYIPKRGVYRSFHKRLFWPISTNAILGTTISSKKHMVIKLKDK